jgi:hypothetical protein
MYHNTLTFVLPLKTSTCKYIKNMLLKKKGCIERFALLQIEVGKGAMNVKETTWFILTGSNRIRGYPESMKGNIVG